MKVSDLAGLAREKGVSAYVGDGLNRWPAIHRFDAVNLFRLTLELAPADSCLHGVGGRIYSVSDDNPINIGELYKLYGILEQVPTKDGWLD